MLETRDAALSIGFGQHNFKAMTDQHQHNQGPDDAQNNEHRITISAARRMLGMLGRNYSDEDLEEALNVLYGIAEEGFEIYRDIDTDGKWNGPSIDDSDE